MNSARLLVITNQRLNSDLLLLRLGDNLELVDLAYAAGIYQDGQGTKPKK